MTMLALVRLLVVVLSGLAGLFIATGVDARPVVGVLGGSLLGAFAVWLEWRARRAAPRHTFWGGPRRGGRPPPGGGAGAAGGVAPARGRGAPRRPLPPPP